MKYWYSLLDETDGPMTNDLVNVSISPLPPPPAPTPYALNTPKEVMEIQCREEKCGGRVEEGGADRL